jgi:L-aminopeptidase/D-esterase-like protein
MEQMVVSRSLVAIMATLAAIAVSVPAAVEADQGNLVPNTKVDGPKVTFDWPAVEVGVASYEEGPTGVTVIRFPRRASVAVDVRGGGPGTVNTDALRLGYGRAFTDAIVFSGGSSYGEEAITAVATGLKEDGMRSGDFSNVASVPGAIIYDFGGRRFNEIYPDKRLAQTALRAARPGVFPLGAQGAGRMAMQGSYFGCDAHSGQGGAFRQVGPTKIAAFVVVNAYGAVTDRAGRLVSCNRAKSWGNLETTSELLQHLPASQKADWDAEAARQEDGPGTRNTTVSLVVTSQKLGYAALQRLAIQVHTSLARAIQPFSTELDGDTLYVASTQETDDKELSALSGLTTLAAEAAETMWDAVLASIPENSIFTPPAISPPVSRAETLAAYTGTYEFGEASVAYGGLGLDIAIEDGGVNVSPREGEPASRAGVIVGDVVTRVDGVPLQGLALGQVVDRLRGPAGSRAELTIVRKGEAWPMTIAVTREPIRPRALLQVQAEGRQLIVEAVGGRQVYEFQRAKPLPVIPLSESEFYVDGRYHTRIAFTRDAAGKVFSAVLNPGRWEQKGRRVN